MTLCNICLREQNTTKLDQFDLCAPCMKEVKKNYIYWKAEAQKGGEIIKQRTSKENIAKQWRKILCK